MPDLRFDYQTFTNNDGLSPSSNPLDYGFHETNQGNINSWIEQENYLSFINSSKFVSLPEVNEVINAYDFNNAIALPLGYQALDISSNLEIDTSKTAALLWYSFLNNEIYRNAFGVRKQQPSIKEEVTKRYSTIKEVESIYIFEIDNDLCIDVLSNLDYLSNRDLEELIDIELEIREIFLDLPISFSYYSNKSYHSAESSIKLY